CMSPSAPPDCAMIWRCTSSTSLRVWYRTTPAACWPLRHTLAQRPVPPAAHAHHVEAFPREDDLPDGFLAVIAGVLQVVPHFHPAHFTLCVANHQQHGKRLLAQTRACVC